MYLAPANLTLYARAVETGGTVQTVQFFAGSTSLGVVANSSQVVFTNLGTELLFPLAWSNVLAGSYALKAVATDAAGMTATSSVVTISVVTNSCRRRRAPVGLYLFPDQQRQICRPDQPDPLRPGALRAPPAWCRRCSFSRGTPAWASCRTAARWWSSNISTAPLFPLAWSNVLAGSYALKAVATDAAGMTATSSVVNITVVSNVPPPNVPYRRRLLVSDQRPELHRPGERCASCLGDWTRTSSRRCSILRARPASASSRNTAGCCSPTSTSGNPFFLCWSNVLAGSYTLTAVATDAAGLMATSPPVNITVLAPPPPPARPCGLYLFPGQRLEIRGPGQPDPLCPGG